jgi:transposase
MRGAKRTEARARRLRAGRDAAGEALADLLARRRQLVAMTTAENNRLGAAREAGIKRRIAALAPLARDRGLMRGTRSVWGGRADVRATLYMVALVASRHNPIIAEFYKRLIANGKKPKVACMRTMLIMLNAMIRDNTEWRRVAKSA